jgi:alpha-beta hydrolase superfamily lysophospholipase
MSHEMDISFLDRPEILEVIFPVAYSPFFPDDYFQFDVSSGRTYSIEVERDTKINCGFWVSGKDMPSILYFHGNGETVAGHEWVAPFYNQRGINLFVADYRGYGSSDGNPTVSNMLTDAHAIFSGFQDVLSKENIERSIFLMGRSLGSIPAIELAFHHQDDISGLIVESGSAHNFRRLWEYLADNEIKAILSEEKPFLNKAKVRQISKPTLIIHGELDQILPVTEGQELYQNSGAADKKLLIIPGADHNDVMIRDQALYFSTIEEFVKSRSR